MRFIKFGLIAIVIALSGCASGVKHKDMAAAIPTVKADQGRIYFYRSSSIVGAALQPAVSLNGVQVGDSKPGGFFYVDSKAGNQEVVCGTEVEKKLTFTLAPGETKYVKTSIGMGLVVGRVIPELVAPEQAQGDIGDLAYTGTVAAQK